VGFCGTFYFETVNPHILLMRPEFSVYVSGQVEMTS